MDTYHVPVLLEEVLFYLQIQSGEKYIDATLGGGGHTQEMLKRGGEVLGIDVDQESIKHVNEKSKSFPLNGGTNLKLKIVKGNFREIKEIAKSNGFEKVAGILFDFGVSSYQLNKAERGFSFLKDAPLDMRMDQQLNVTAADLINVLGKKELYELFIKFGEERQSFAIVNSIISERKIKPIQTTGQLAHLIEKSVGRRDRIPARLATRIVAGRHPATRVFQALRIAVNDEMYAIEKSLPNAFDLLKKNGRILAISFHSLEDRIVKNTFNSLEKSGKGKIVTAKPVIPGEEEIARNPRSRSSKLRVIEKI